MKSIILSPHFDDAVFDCWQQLAATDSQIVTIFSRIPESGTHTIWDLMCGDYNSNSMVQKRQAENDLALAGLNSVGLDYLDKQYRKKDPTVDELISAIDSRTDKYDRVVCPMAASTIFKHPDHVLVRLVGLRLYQLGKKVVFYPDIPYMMLPANPSAVFLHRLEAKSSALASLELKAKVYEFDAEEIQAKLAAAQAYKSQLGAVNFVSVGRLKKYLTRKYEILLEPA